MENKFITNAMPIAGDSVLNTYALESQFWDRILSNVC